MAALRVGESVFDGVGWVGPAAQGRFQLCGVRFFFQVKPVFANRDRFTTTNPPPPQKKKLRTEEGISATT